ncbi:MAG: DivIVA domain-containing protein, partial [Acidimicrobiales bacterium]
FLEKVADAVDRLQGDVRAAAERAEAAERTVREHPALEDEESIRRTLVLAQRTADLAVREAQEEAAVILDRARSEAETLVGDARDSASRMTSEAERRLREEVSHLGTTRDELRKEIGTLLSLLEAERERLTETLGAALRYVERSMSPSGELLAAAPALSRDGTNGPPGGGNPQDNAADRESSDLVASEASTGPAPASVAVSPMTDTAAVPTVAQPAIEGTAEPGDVDPLEAAIAEDAAAAAPLYARQGDQEDYDWDSVIRARPEPLFPDRAGPRVERPNLTALPSMKDSPKDSSALRVEAGGVD